jgi:hypothetical protein
MEEKYSGMWTSVTNYLETAVLLPRRHDEMISRALQQLLTSIPAVGTALIWPCPEGEVPWKVYYAGIKHNEMHHWLSSRLNSSLIVTTGALRQDLAHGLSDMPPSYLMRLHTLPACLRGLWIVWMAPSSVPSLPEEVMLEWTKPVCQTLEAVLEVEDKEAQYFSASSPLRDQALIEALAHDDTLALSAFLSMTRLIGKADCTCWGRAYDNAIEVSSHVGAKQRGFGFALPLGHGMGGQLAVRRMPIMVTEDYRTSPYRDPIVSDTIDAEGVRSVIVLPVCYYTAPERSAAVAAVFYASRRTVNPFSLAERLLMQRQGSILGQLTLEMRARSFFLPDAGLLASPQS